MTKGVEDGMGDEQTNFHERAAMQRALDAEYARSIPSAPATTETAEEAWNRGYETGCKDAIFDETGCQLDSVEVPPYTPPLAPSESATTEPVTVGSGNVFTDLGFPEAEAVELDRQARELAMKDEAESATTEVRGKASPEMEYWVAVPDEQGWWWHWDGDGDHAPFMCSVLTSLSRKINREFIAFPDSRWCCDVGGLWLKAKEPDLPRYHIEGKG